MSIGDFTESLSQAMLIGCNVSREIGHKPVCKKHANTCGQQKLQTARSSNFDGSAPGLTNFPKLCVIHIYIYIYIYKCMYIYMYYIYIYREIYIYIYI